ncbi:hypothetical protein R3P38DRAFT_3188913 [Favolaschia claudopus]|uniref:Uncharacterized protein n=1 Tax=Favolaschia claudopus TaxID=2862362 RepID=A0AAW0BU21_9AGAR
MYTPLQLGGFGACYQMPSSQPYSRPRRSATAVAGAHSHVLHHHHHIVSSAPAGLYSSGGFGSSSPFASAAPALMHSNSFGTPHTAYHSLDDTSRSRITRRTIQMSTRDRDSVFDYDEASSAFSIPDEMDEAASWAGGGGGGMGGGSGGFVAA